MAARHLPAAVNAPVCAFGNERHRFGVFVARLEIVKRGRGADRVTERRVLGDVVDQPTVDVDGAAVLQGSDVFGAGLGGRHGGSPVTHPTLIAWEMTKAA